MDSTVGGGVAATTTVRAGAGEEDASTADGVGQLLGCATVLS